MELNNTEQHYFVLTDLNPEVLMLVLNDMMPSYLKLHVANLLLSNGEDSEPSLSTQASRPMFLIHY